MMLQEPDIQIQEVEEKCKDEDSQKNRWEND